MTTGNPYFDDRLQQEIRREKRRLQREAEREAEQQRIAQLQAEREAKRLAEWEAGQPERERIAAEAALKKREEKHEAKITNSGIKYSDWLKWALSLYEIIEIPEDEKKNKFKVVSRAVEWKQERSWPCDSRIGCYEKIDQLVDWKMADRKRGNGSEAKDLAV